LALAVANKPMIGVIRDIHLLAGGDPERGWFGRGAEGWSGRVVRDIH
jgi:hypothetical protein